MTAGTIILDFGDFMSLNEILLIIAALLPAIVLLLYVYSKDRAEKEPLPLLLLLLAAGAIIIIPSIIFELLLGSVIDFAFGVTEESLSSLASDPVLFRIYSGISMLLGVALVEEFFKWISMLIITRRSKHFNSLFDGLVYAIFVSLGFAALENVFYVLENGWGNALMRAVLSVPGHMFFAVTMGYFYSMWHMNDKAKSFERKFTELGVIRPSQSQFDSDIYKGLSIIVPVLIHGFYNYCCTVGSILEIVIMIALIIVLYIFCFKRIKAMSFEDTSDTVFALRLLHKKYPEIAQWASLNPEIYNSII